jgi:hypothetical protein
MLTAFVLAAGADLGAFSTCGGVFGAAIRAYFGLSHDELLGG